jgi:sugar-specific transcriptional regulator TrmB
MNLGLTKAEAKVYFYLSKRGPRKASEITSTLKMKRQQLYPVIRKLQSESIITSTLDRPAEFSAVALEKILDLFAKAKFEEAKTIQLTKGKLLSDWQLLSHPEFKGRSSFFTVIKGTKIVYSKIQQMIQETQSQISVISDIAGLFHAEQFGILDVMESHPKKQDIQFRIVTEVPINYLQAVKDLLKTINPEIKIKARNTDIGLALFPRMVIRDNKEILYFVSAKPDEIEENNDAALSTDCSSLVKPLSTVFENLWNHSALIEQKIDELERGEDPPRTLLIEDTDEAKTKYVDILRKAKKEIIFVVSAERLADFQEELPRIRSQTQENLSIRIMSPIINENLRIAKKLLAYGEVRHIPRNFLETTIVDGKHLFQFNKSRLSEGLLSTENINHTFYTNNGEYVRKTKSMLEYIWKNSTSPSITPIVSIVDSLDSFSLIPKSCSGYSSKVITDWLKSKSCERSTRELTEKEVLEKIFHLNRSSNPSKNVVECYTRFGYAAINPPEHFNLPKIIVETAQVDKKSTFGAEDRMTFYLWQKTQQGYNYVPVAIISNSESFPVDLLSTGELRNTPAEKNVYVLKKGEIHFQYYGNVFLASWTKPVPLVPGKLVLSPGTLIFETYGEVKPAKVVLRYPLGAVYEVYFNAFDAFVTFLYESSRYVGSGTDGLFLRDAYLEISVPETPD